MGIKDVNVSLNLEKSKYGYGIRCFQCGSFNILDVLLRKIVTEQLKAQLKGYQEAKKEILKDEIDFLNGLITEKELINDDMKEEIEKRIKELINGRK